MVYLHSTIKMMHGQINIRFNIYLPNALTLVPRVPNYSPHDDYDSGVEAQLDTHWGNLLASSFHIVTTTWEHAWVSIRTGVKVSEKTKILLPLSVLEPRLPSHPACSVRTIYYLLVYPASFQYLHRKKNVQINLYRSQIIYILRNQHILYNNTAEFVLTEETPLCLRNQKSQKCLQQYCTCGTKLRFQLQKSGCLWRIYTSNKIKQIRVIISLQHTRSLGTWLIEVNIDITFYDLSLYVHTSTEVITFTGCS